MGKYGIWIQFIIGIVIGGQVGNAEESDIAYQKVAIHRPLIEHAARLFQVDPVCLSAIIYTERVLNYDWRDDLFDVALFEQAGLNSSIGFCQIKIKTAYFIEYEFHHPDSPYYPGDEYSNMVKLSETKKELLDKIVLDSVNICYAAAYLKMIQNRWTKAGFPIDDRPDIVGTLYSTGLYRADGTERKPNKNPRSNSFGDLVKKSLPLFSP